MKKPAVSAANMRYLLSHPDDWAASDIPLLPWGSAIDQLVAYSELLLKWNRQLNLSGARAPGELLGDLIQDSFYLAAFLDRLFPFDDKKLAIWDLGAGAGLPGVPLRIIWHRGAYTWVEASQKRSLFLQTVQASLKLPAFGGYTGKVEAFFNRSDSRPADCIISRAFRPWRSLLGLCKPMLAPAGSLVIMANEPPPPLPDQWYLREVLEYQAGRKRRWIWAVSGMQ